MKKRTQYERATEAAKALAKECLREIDEPRGGRCDLYVQHFLFQAWRKGYEAAVRDRKKAKG